MARPEALEARGSERQAAGDLTRADFLRRAAGGGAGLFLLGGAGAAARAASGAESAAVRSTGNVQWFVSRPDLRPPVVTVVHAARRTSPGYVFIAPSSGPGQRGTMILDNDGELIWFKPTVPQTAMNFRPMLYRGKPVLVWWEGKSNKGLGAGECVIVDGRYREIARFSSGQRKHDDLHELLITPDNTALVSYNETITGDLTAVGGTSNAPLVGGVVHELAIPSGRVLHEWKSLDHVDITESYQGIGPKYDYFHINSIDIDADGDLLVSARNTWTLYKVDRESGEIKWRLGGKKSDFTMGPGTNFEWQHDARHHGNGSRISLFDNAAAPAKEKQTRILLIGLDFKRMHARLVQQWIHPNQRLLTKFMGNAQFLPNGDVFVGWGAEPYMTEFGPDGKLRFDAKLPKGGQNYRAFRSPWTGEPKEPPALVAKGKRLYVSWNGSTALDSWRIEWGTSRNLRSSLVQPKKGFETVIQPPAAARYAAAVALDGAGKHLGRSKTVKL